MIPPDGGVAKMDFSVALRVVSVALMATLCVVPCAHWMDSFLRSPFHLKPGDCSPVGMGVP